MVEAAHAQYPDLRAVSFGRGFHSPANRPGRKKDLLKTNALANPGRYFSKAERKREQDVAFIAMRSQHPAVDSAINNLERRVLDRPWPAHGAPWASPAWWRCP